MGSWEAFAVPKVRGMHAKSGLFRLFLYSMLCCLGVAHAGDSRSVGQLVSCGRLTMPPISPDEKFVAVATGNVHIVVLKEAGTVPGWGAAGVAFGAVHIPAAVTNVVSIVASATDTIALRSDGTLVGWWQNRNRFNTLFAGWNNVKTVWIGRMRAIA